MSKAEFGLGGGLVHHIGPWRGASAAAAAESSRTANWPGTFASNGNSCRSRSQNAWIVWIFSPPGVSSALAKSRRAWRISCCGRRASLDFCDRLCELGLAKHRPFAERAEDTARHLGRRNLGEGQAEDRGGIGAGEHQPDHALGQHMSLAGAGIGDDPRGCARVGGIALVRPRAIEEQADGTKSSSS